MNSKLQFISLTFFYKKTLYYEYDDWLKANLDLKAITLITSVFVCVKGLENIDKYYEKEKSKNNLWNKIFR